MAWTSVYDDREIQSGVGVCIIICPFHLFMCYCILYFLCGPRTTTKVLRYHSLSLVHEKDAFSVTAAQYYLVHMNDRTTKLQLIMVSVISLRP